MEFDGTKGGWISGHNWVLDARPLLFNPIVFRKDFELPSAPKKAELILAAAEKFVLYVNGKFIDQGPVRSYSARKVYDRYELAPYFKKGKNSIAVMIFPSNATNIIGTYERPGLLLQAEFKPASGKSVKIFTDEHWHTRTAEWIKVAQRVISLPVGQQLHFESARETKNWKAGALGNGWKKAGLLGPVEMPPWLSLEERYTARLVENPISPLLIWKGFGNRDIIDLKDNLTPLFNKEPIKGCRVKLPSCGVQFYNKAENVYCFDFGKTRFLRPVLKITGVTAQTRVELYYDMQFEGRPTSFGGFGSEIEGGYDTCLVEKGNYDWELQLPRGFRFMTVKLTGKGKAKFELQCRSVDYPFENNAKFEAKDNFWQTLWNMATENLRSSTTDVAVDCCSRENLLWTQDAAVSTRAAYHSFGETAMWRYCMDLVGQGVDPDGRPSAVVPSDIPSSLYCQQMHWVTSIWEYYMATGDKTLLVVIGPAISRYIKECEKRVTKEDLFIPPGHSWYWLDWAPVDKRAYSLPINTLLVMACEAAEKIAAEIHDKELEKRSAKIAMRIKKAIPKFFDAKKGAFRSHIEPKLKLKLETERISSRTNEVAKAVTHNVHSNLWSASIGAGTPEMQKAALRFAAQCFMQQPGPHNQISYPNLVVLMAPLVKAGYLEAVYRVIDILYRDYIDLKVPTFNETHIPTIGSQGWGRVEEFNTAHGWAATINTLIVAHLIGLKPLKPGWKELGFFPRPEFKIDYRYSLIIPGGVVSVVHENGKYSAVWPKGRMLAFRNRKFSGTGKVVALAKI